MTDAEKTKTRTEGGSFFAELKRRNVYKVAVAYAVVAWLLIQAASILFPTFEAPGWVMKVFVTVVLLGFPVALVLSWAFEITPEGIKLESEIDRAKPTTGRTGQKLIGLTVILAADRSELIHCAASSLQSKCPRDNGRSILQPEFGKCHPGEIHRRPPL